MYLDTEQLAERWGYNQRTLDNRRQQGRMPKFKKKGGTQTGKVYYHIDDVIEYEIENDMMVGVDDNV